MALKIDEQQVAEALDPTTYDLDFGKVLKHLVKFKEVENLEMANQFFDDIVASCDVTEIIHVHELFESLARLLQRELPTNGY